MSNGSSRPGGLTALAVLNFIFSALAGLGCLGYVFILAAANSKVRDNFPGGTTMIMAGIAGSILVMLLLIVSGVGYIKLNPIFGRIVGTVYGFFAIGMGVLQHTLMEQEFGILNLVGFIYPVMTLILLNTTFRRDFASA